MNDGTSPQELARFAARTHQFGMTRRAKGVGLIVIATGGDGAHCRRTTDALTTAQILESVAIGLREDHAREELARQEAANTPEAG